MKRSQVKILSGVNLLGAASLCVLAAAGCSSKSETPVPPVSPGESAPAAHGGFAECLKAHGVKDPGGQAVMIGPPDGVDQATWDQAMTACSTLAPGPGSP